MASSDWSCYLIVLKERLTIHRFAGSVKKQLPVFRLWAMHGVHSSGFSRGVLFVTFWLAEAACVTASQGSLINQPLNLVEFYRRLSGSFSPQGEGRVGKGVGSFTIREGCWLGHNCPHPPPQPPGSVFSILPTQQCHLLKWSSQTNIHLSWAQ